MKKCLLTLLAILTFFSFGSMLQEREAQANEVELELLGKLGGMSNFIDKESFGDTEFSIAGGLNFTALFRFDMGVGIGVNVNWTMAKQRLAVSKLTYALEARDRWTTVQLPSFGLALRYALSDAVDTGLWLNYGFGSVSNDLDIQNGVTAKAFGLAGAHLDWNLQTLEVGVMGAFTWELPSIPLSIVIGLHIYGDFSHMYADDHTLDDARDVSGRRLDENSITSVGFNVLFGARYDFYLSKSKNKKRQ